jgi:hypothetical protein
MSKYDDKDEVKKRDNRIEFEERKRIESFGFIMSTPEGRLFMNWLLGECGIMRISYSGKLPNEATFFNEGMRNIGLKIFSVIDQHFPKEWLAMREEAKKRDEEITNHG